MQILASAAVCILLAAGCSSDKAQKSGSASTDTSQHGDQLSGMNGAAIKSNAMAVTAVVESVAVIDDVHYRLFVRIISSDSRAEGMETVADSSRRMVLSPEYVLDEQGKCDRSNERNNRLVTLLSAKSGDRITGKISLLQDKGWVIVDAGKH
jgi:hypothetical protein